MVFSTSSVLGAMLAMAPLVAHAHIIMQVPTPFGTAPPKQDPLSPDNFPCQNAPSTGATVSEWAVGSSQILQLIGSSVHSGGSCQVSVTMDKAPTKDSIWKVIHSWEGGCPDVPREGGNWEPADASMVRPPMNFTVPTELPNGEMSMAWTWNNKMGNREFYMNCAAVKISGGASDNTAFDTLPDMAVANLAGIGPKPCEALEDHDYLYEAPGKYVTKGGTGPFVPLCGGASTPGAPAGDAPAGGAPANPGIPSPVVSVAPGTLPAASGSMSAPVVSAAPPAASGSMATPAASGAKTSTIRVTSTVTAPSGPPPAGKTPVAPPASGAMNGTAPASPSAAPAAPLPSGAACSPDGAVICSPDGKQFALCNHGKAVFQAVAGGTTCSGGKIARRQEPSTMRTVYA